MRRSVLTIVPLTAVATGAWAAPSDPREYAEWSAPEYAAFVKIGNKDGTFCTGQFVSPQLIVTNAHCALDCDNAACHITTSSGGVYAVDYMDGGQFRTTLFSANTETDFDFAFFKIKDPQYKSSTYFPVANRYYTGEVFNAGFGSLRVLSDQEIQSVRRTYVEILRQEDFEDMRQYNPDLSYQDFRQMQKMSNMDATYNARPFSKKYFQSLDQALAAQGIKPVFQDMENFKVHKNCRVIKADATNMQHNCRMAPGNSGGGLISPDGELTGLVNSNKDILGEFGGLGLGVATPVFYDKYIQLMENITW